MKKQEAMDFLNRYFPWGIQRPPQEYNGDPCCGVLRLREIPDDWRDDFPKSFTTASKTFLRYSTYGVIWFCLVDQSPARIQTWVDLGWRITSQFHNPNSERDVTFFELRSKKA